MKNEMLIITDNYHTDFYCTSHRKYMFMASSIIGLYEDDRKDRPFGIITKPFRIDLCRDDAEEYLKVKEAFLRYNNQKEN